MSTNISKKRRENLINKINEIKNYLIENVLNTEFIGYLSELENEIKGTKYGLVYEEHREKIDEILNTHTPVFVEEKELFIDNGGQLNFLIEGDNLPALKLLNKTHKGKIDVIYIDPPYNRGSNDFIYDDKYVGKTDSFRHSKWLSFMNDRLKLAKTLLSEHGVIFISCDDNEQAQLKMLCDEVFGYSNFVGTLIWRKKSGGGQTDEFFVTEHEYIHVYRKSPKFLWIDEKIPITEKGFNMEDDRGKYKIVKLAKWGSAAKKEDRPTMHFPIKSPDGKNVYPIAPDGSPGRWRVGKKTMELLIIQNKIHWEKVDNEWIAYEKIYFEDNDVKILKSRSILYEIAETGDASKMLTSIFGKKDVFENPKPIELIQEILSHTKNSIVLDFFAGSGSTGHAVLKMNSEDGGKRKFILVTNNQNNICRDITFERIKKVIEKENYSASLKYYKIDFVNIDKQLYYEYADKLLLHIKELVQLENGIDLQNNPKVWIAVTDEGIDDFIKDIEKYKKCKKLYLGHDVLLSKEQEEILKQYNIKIVAIPDYYYGELKG